MWFPRWTACDNAPETPRDVRRTRCKEEFLGKRDLLGKAVDWLFMRTVGAYTFLNLKVRGLVI